MLGFARKLLVVPAADAMTTPVASHPTAATSMAAVGTRSAWVGNLRASTRRFAWEDERSRGATRFAGSQGPAGSAGPAGQAGPAGPATWSSNL